MKDIKTSTILLAIVVIFIVFCAGIFVGRQSTDSGYVIQTEREVVASTAVTTQTEQNTTVATTTAQQEQEESTQETDAIIDLNTATKEELMTLPGIGEKLAQRILDYREANGPFQSVEDLDFVEGIGTKTLDKLRDLVKVGD